MWQKLPDNSASQLESTENVCSQSGEEIPLHNLSATQLQVLRKLALLKLTSHMEKYCPSHRTGWNWDLPKFIRKMKAPVYKGTSILLHPSFMCISQLYKRTIISIMYLFKITYYARRLQYHELQSLSIIFR